MLLSSESKRATSSHREPLQLGGFLEHYDYFDVTPTIGREYCGVNLKEWIKVFLDH